MTGPRRTPEAAKALDIDPETLDRWGRLGVVRPLVAIDDTFYWDVEDVRAQVQRIREGQQD